jgi:hypothetical protein
MATVPNAVILKLFIDPASVLSIKAANFNDTDTKST